MTIEIVRLSDIHISKRNLVVCYYKNQIAKTILSKVYPKLCQYLWNDKHIYSKRIDEKKSSNTKGERGNIWLHPDMVGIKNLSEKWNQEVVNCASQHAYNKTSLWSFEVKAKLNTSNVRESFFQTVSNSSWANHSYLVAGDIDDKVMDELNMLCSAHSIGVILLNEEFPNESQILIPTKEKEALDWDMINRITEVNPDFKSYISMIREFYQTGSLKERDWDFKG